MKLQRAELLVLVLFMTLVPVHAEVDKQHRSRGESGPGSVRLKMMAQVSTVATAPPVTTRGFGNVTIYVAPPGRTRKLLLRLTTQAKMKWKVRVGFNKRLYPTISGNPTIKTDASSDLIPGQDQLAIESLVETILPPILKRITSAWSGIPVPVHSGLTLQNVALKQDGTKKDFLSLTADLR